MSEISQKKYFQTGGILLIFLGIVFLLNNFNLVSSSTWNYLWNLWPLILIFLGLEALLGASKVASKLLSLIALAICVYLLLLITGNARKITIKYPFQTPTPTPHIFRYDYNFPLF